jgi:Bacterial protein of unknown function (DUF899)
MTDHRIGTREEWQAARDELLQREKELTHRNDELAEKRRELPWVPIERQYSFDTDSGAKSLAKLFDGRSQRGASELDGHADGARDVAGRDLFGAEVGRAASRRDRPRRRPGPLVVPDP